MSSISIGLSVTAGGFVDAGPAAGPTIDTAGSLDVSTFKIGTEHTITAGTASATGGGSVTYEYRWLVAGVSDASTAAYTPLAANDEDTIAAQWRAVETGGTNPGETAWQTVGSGTITYDAAVNSVVPTISGSTSLGGTLTGTTGTWSGTVGGVYSFQWRRDGIDIPLATESTYEIVLADSGTQITCAVTYTNSGGSTTAVSNSLTIGTFAPPVITGSPTVSGTAQVGQTLTVEAAPVTGNPTPTRQWQWVNSVSGDIPGASGLSYVVKASDEGATISVRQIETNPLGSDNATSAQTAAVTAGVAAITALVASNQGADGSVSVTYTISADSAVTGVLTDSPVAPTAAQILAGQDEAGNPAESAFTDTWTVLGTNSVENIAAGISGGPFYLHVLPSGGGDGDVASSNSFTLETVAPTVTAAETSAGGGTVTLTLSEPVSGTAAAGDWQVYDDGAPLGVAAVSAIAGTTSIVLTLTNPVPDGVSVITFDYVPGDIEDAVSNPLAAISGGAVTNNVAGTAEITSIVGETDGIHITYTGTLAIIGETDGIHLEVT